jgi:hypothetical protein
VETYIPTKTICYGHLKDWKESYENQLDGTLTRGELSNGIKRAARGGWHGFRRSQCDKQTKQTNLPSFIDRDGFEEEAKLLSIHAWIWATR